MKEENILGLKDYNGRVVARIEDRPPICRLGCEVNHPIVAKTISRSAKAMGKYLFHSKSRSIGIRQTKSETRVTNSRSVSEGSGLNELLIPSSLTNTSPCACPNSSTAELRIQLSCLPTVLVLLLVLVPFDSQLNQPIDQIRIRQS